MGNNPKKSVGKDAALNVTNKQRLWLLYFWPLYLLLAASGEPYFAGIQKRILKNENDSR